MVTRCFLTHDSRVMGQTLPVGQPVEDTEIQLVDINGQPAGFAGELAIRSRFVTPGYWNRDELSGHTPTIDSLGTEPGTFGTGDIVMRLPDGQLLYVGRRDGQVKVRGHRVETGEIESVLLTHPHVAAAAVVLRHSPNGGAHLVAYAQTNVPAEELRSWLRVQLPEYMVPSFVMPIESLPRLPNGKVDRSNLPEAETPVGSGAGNGAATTEAERTLLEVWSELLDAEHIGIHDDFFALGGHSLMAARMISRIRDRLNVDFPIVKLFEKPTIHELARDVDASLPRDTPDRAAPIRRQRRSVRIR